MISTKTTEVASPDSWKKKSLPTYPGFDLAATHQVAHKTLAANSEQFSFPILPQQPLTGSALQFGPAPLQVHPSPLGFVTTALPISSAPSNIDFTTLKRSSSEGMQPAKTTLTLMRKRSLDEALPELTFLSTQGKKPSLYCDEHIPKD